MLSMIFMFTQLDTWVPFDGFSLLRGPNGSAPRGVRLKGACVCAGRLSVGAAAGMERAHLHTPEPELRAVIWATRNKVVVIRTPRYVRNAIRVSF